MVRKSGRYSTYLSEYRVFLRSSIVTIALDLSDVSIWGTGHGIVLETFHFRSACIVSDSSYFPTSSSSWRPQQTKTPRHHRQPYHLPGGLRTSMSITAEFVNRKTRFRQINSVFVLISYLLGNLIICHAGSSATQHEALRGN
ncbi:hypothetical protein BDV36DRAFT_114423 [Aspergillus pseudocaelatus]|uniref:Uncharacterized protein n=1 Tax=Aspergillus pseudocaelatus TaxID=1825620 RepID=A0ABQ6W0H6_9EURO|nr:hypothetical protein BDV36DRAFT_114423 [Aspergillus pseudocaelatus]